MRLSIPLLLCLGASLAQARADLSLLDRGTPAAPLSRRFAVRVPHPSAVRLTCEEQGGRGERHAVVSPTTLERHTIVSHATLERHTVVSRAVLEHDLTLRGLKASTRYRCVASALDRPSIRSAPVSFQTAALPRELRAPVLTVPSNDPAKTGYTLYNYGVVQSSSRLPVPIANYLVIVDADANVRWYYKGPGCGDVDASYLGGDRLLFGGRSSRVYAPTIIDLDGVIRFQGTAAASTADETAGAFHHDAGLSADGSSIFTLVDADVDGTWKGFVLKEIDLETNSVRWFWDSVADGVETGALPAGSRQDTDPFHANSVFDRWEDGRLYVYVSMRNQSRVLKIDYLSRDVVWLLGVGGDFELLEPDGARADDARWFFNQHDVSRVGDRLLAYDNGTDRDIYGGTAYSRALQLELDEARGTARIVFEYTEPGWSEPVWGGYDALPGGNTLVDLGHCYQEDDDFYDLCSGLPGLEHRSALIELSPAGQTVWRADFDDLRVASYRAERIDGCAIFDNETYCPAAAGSVLAPQ